ncbi:MAG: glycosyltransferase [Sarcina sp.]
MKNLSVIVPVYNVEKYIKECIESLLSQNIDNMEIIIVDDGSKDDSITIVKEFNDERLTVLHKENGGLSSARNFGLEAAKGEYVCFIDSDDFIKGKDSFKKLYEKAKRENLDILTGKFSWYYSEKNIKEDKRTEPLALKEPISGKEYLKRALKIDAYIAIACTQFYKREFLNKNSLKFKEGIFHEDEQFTPRALLKAERVNVSLIDFYMYRQREGSIMNSSSKSKDSKRVEDVYGIFRDLAKEIDNEKDEDLKRELRSYIVDLILKYGYIFKLKKVPKEFKKRYAYELLNKNVAIKLRIFNIKESFYYRFQDLISLAKKSKN